MQLAPPIACFQIRTAVTLAQRAGRPLEAITALTQHRRPGVVGVYARHAYEDEKRDVVEAIDKAVATIAAA